MKKLLSAMAGAAFMFVNAGAGMSTKPGFQPIKPGQVLDIRMKNKSEIIKVPENNTLTFGDFKKITAQKLGIPSDKPQRWLSKGKEVFDINGNLPRDDQKMTELYVSYDDPITVIVPLDPEAEPDKSPEDIKIINLKNEITMINSKIDNTRDDIEELEKENKKEKDIKYYLKRPFIKSETKLALEAAKKELDKLLKDKKKFTDELNKIRKIKKPRL